MIRTVYLWANGMLMVFDDNGEQMPQYQGPMRSYLGPVLRDATPETEWRIGSWRHGAVEASRGEFECMLEYSRPSRPGQPE